MPPLLLQFILFGILGWTTEILYTGFKNLLKNRDYMLFGRTSFWILPVYGTIALFFPIVQSYVHHWRWPFRGLVYLLVIWSIEYVSGEFFKRILRKPVWHYTSRWSIHGNVNLLHAPLFFGFGLIVEWTYPRIVAISELGLF
ncbi:MAG: hypothetical protein A2053_01995 [Deltaproteobacteria bacterium GWA2_50_8]|nr:MAG: hypothetical protein A2053_01995 [Deltaproteobacteria bacterium GWA2_50_8]